jgi:hypothetical protein
MGDANYSFSGDFAFSYLGSLPVSTSAINYSINLTSSGSIFSGLIVISVYFSLG